MVQSTFQNALKLFKHKPYNFYIRLSSKRILTKNLNLIFFVDVVGRGGGGGGGTETKTVCQTVSNEVK